MIMSAAEQEVIPIPAEDGCGRFCSCILDAIPSLASYHCESIKLIRGPPSRSGSSY